jgi:hypothetical protein
VLVWVIGHIRHDDWDGTPAGSVDTNQADIARDCELSVRTVRMALVALQEAGSIVCSRTGRGVRITAVHADRWRVRDRQPLPTADASDRQPLPIRPATIADQDPGFDPSDLGDDRQPLPIRSATVAALSISEKEQEEPDPEKKTVGEPPRLSSAVSPPVEGDTATGVTNREKAEASVQRQNAPRTAVTALGPPGTALAPETPDSGQAEAASAKPAREKAPHQAAMDYFHARWLERYGTPPTWTDGRGRGGGAQAFHTLAKKLPLPELLRRIDKAFDAPPAWMDQPITWKTFVSQVDRFVGPAPGADRKPQATVRVSADQALELARRIRSRGGQP